MTSQNSSLHGTELSSTESPSSPFVTTSDVMNQLNKHLSNLSGKDTNGTDQQEQQMPKFELQKRLPDGSAIPATPDEIAAADFKTKLEQTAKFVSQLSTPADRQYWAEQQRLLGNTYFGRGEYKSAMDVYLTCLVVKEGTTDFVNKTLIPILNNLAQCTLQLGMYRKTTLFCDIALQEIRNIGKDGSCPERNDDDDNNRGDTDDVSSNGIDKVDHLAVCKIYYKLAKAQRLSGNYGEARIALDSSLESLELKLEEMGSLSGGTSTTATTTTAAAGDKSKSALMMPYQQAIQKEYRHLDVAEKEARRNHQRQKRAMQNVLSTSKTSSATSGTVKKGTAGSLYYDHEETSSSIPAEPRKFSTLRARKAPTSHLNDVTPSSTTTNRHTSGKSNNSPTRLSTYSQYYWSMVERVTSFLLAVLEDDGEDEGRKRSDHSDGKDDR